MVPVAENLVEAGRIPGSDPKSLTGLDAVVHHPGNRYSALIIRMLSAAIILDRQTWEPVCVLHNPEGSPGNLKITKVASAPDVWECQFDDVKCVGHEAGFSPDRKIFTMMNNIQQNDMAVFDTSDPDPRQWRIRLPDFQRLSAHVGGRVRVPPGHPRPPGLPAQFRRSP